MNKSKKTLATLTIACCLALAVFVISGCAQQQQKNDTTSQPADITALIVYAQDGEYLFVDTETGTPFFPNLTNVTITNSSGSKVSSENLAVGDIVSITGDGAMTMSYPALYPGISKVKIVSRGNMDDVEEYTDVVLMLFPPMGENDIPTGWLNYDTSVGSITLALDAYSYEGFAIVPSTDKSDEDGSNDTDEPSEPRIQSLEGSYANDSGFILEQVADARFKDALDATVGFSSTFQVASVHRQPINEASGGRVRVELTAPLESVGTTVVGNGEIVLTIEAGYVYIVNVEFANGEASYAFTTLDY